MEERIRGPNENYFTTADPKSLLNAFIPNSCQDDQAATKSIVGRLSIQDVPMLLQDFSNILLRLERKCIIAQTKEIALQTFTPIQTDARICSCLNERLYRFFYTSQDPHNTEKSTNLNCRPNTAHSADISRGQQQTGEGSGAVNDTSFRSLRECIINSATNSCMSQKSVGRNNSFNDNFGKVVGGETKKYGTNIISQDKSGKRMSVNSDDTADSVHGMSSYRIDSAPKSLSSCQNSDKSAKALHSTTLSPEVSLLMAKLRKDYERISAKFVQLATSYSIIPPKQTRDRSLNAQKDCCDGKTIELDNGFSPVDTPESFTSWSAAATPMPSIIVSSTEKHSVNDSLRSNRRSEGIIAPSFDGWKIPTSNCMAQMWDTQLDAELRYEQLQELKQLENCVQTLKSLQLHIGLETIAAQEPLDSIEEMMESSEIQSSQAVVELAKASKARTKWWMVGGSGAGFVAGGLSGLAFGPIGFVAGAAVGGVVGMASSSVLRRRHKRQMDLICHSHSNGSQPQPVSASFSTVRTGSSRAALCHR